MLSSLQWNVSDLSGWQQIDKWVATATVIIYNSMEEIEFQTPGHNVYNAENDLSNQ